MVTPLNEPAGAGTGTRRVRIEDGQGETIVHLTPRRHLGAILVNALILAGGLFGLGFGLLLLAADTMSAPGLMQLWLMIWSLGVIWMLINFLWPLFGRERWTATSKALSRKASILGLGPTITYPAGEISGLRYIHDDVTRRVRVNGRDVPQPALQFHLGGRAINFAHGISRADADKVVSVVMQRLHTARERHR